MWQEEKSLKCNVLCIQETHFAQQKQPNSTEKLYPQICTASRPTTKCRVLIAITHSVTFQLHDVIRDKAYTLVNLYAPNSAQLLFLRCLIKKVHKLKKALLLYCGDYNCVLNKQLDCSSPLHSTRNELKPFLHTSDLYDLWRCVNSGEKEFTY